MQAINRKTMHQAPRRAFTLAESLIASVILAVAVVGISTTLHATSMQMAQLENDSYARALASELIEEISAKPLVAVDATAGWANGETDKTQYDTVNDFAGYSDGTPLPTIEGTPTVVAKVPFTRQVTLTSPTSLFGATQESGEFVVVQVTARDVYGRACTLNRLVSKTTLKR